MAKLSTVQGWGFSCIGYEVAADGVTVTSIYCKTCRDFFTTANDNSTFKNKAGIVKQQADTFVKGNTTV